MKKYHIETMGCQMNERDSETIAGMLENLGYACAGLPGEKSEPGQLAPEMSPAELRAEADIIVVNTCMTGGHDVLSPQAGLVCRKRWKPCGFLRRNCF
ncbi:MAG: hypothetical protein LBL36_02640 [Clostridiales Family XIII bacterium]|nr:hypothetical protein [Clostridiales Family XIII bacterium]